MKKVFITGLPRSGTTLTYSIISNKNDLTEFLFLDQFINLFKYFTTRSHTVDLIDLFSQKEKKQINKLITKFIDEFLLLTNKSIKDKNAIIFKRPLSLTEVIIAKDIIDDCKIVYCLMNPISIISSYLQVMKRGHLDRLSKKYNNKFFMKIKNFLYLKTRFRKLVKSIKEEYKLICEVVYLSKTLKDKFFIFRYEDAVKMKEWTFEELEAFLGFKVNKTGFNDKKKYKASNINDKLYHSEDYGKKITDKNIDKYRSLLNRWQIKYINKEFADINKLLGYND